MLYLSVWSLIPYGMGGRILESEEYKEVRNTFKRLDWTGEFFFLLFIFTFYFFLIYPFIIETILNQEGWLYSVDSRRFMVEVFGWYDYRVHCILVLISMVIGGCISIVIAKLVRTRWKSKGTFSHQNNEKLFIPLAIVLMISSMLLVPGNIFSERLGILLPTFFPVHLVEGMWMGVAVAGYRDCKRLMTHLNIPMDKVPRKKKPTIGVILSFLAAASFFITGGIVAVRGEVLPFVQVSFVRIVVGMNIILGVMVMLGALLLWNGHHIAGSVVVPVFSYFSLGIGGGFYFGVGLGIAGGLLGFVNSRYGLDTDTVFSNS